MLMGGGGNGPGNNSMWSGGIAPVKPITDQSDHVDGGNLVSSNGTNASATPSARAIMYGSAIIVLSAITLLWLMGAIVVKGASL